MIYLLLIPIIVYFLAGLSGYLYEIYSRPKPIWTECKTTKEQTDFWLKRMTDGETSLGGYSR